MQQSAASSAQPAREEVQGDEEQQEEQGMSPEGWAGHMALLAPSRMGRCGGLGCDMGELVWLPPGLAAQGVVCALTGV